MRQEVFQIDEKKLEGLIQCVSKFPSKGSSDNGYIYINLSMVRLQTVWYLPKLIYALGMSNVTCNKIKVIMWRRNKLFEKLISSMGMEQLCLEEMTRKNIFSAVIAFIYTVQLCVIKGTGRDLQKFRKDSIPIGMALYEDIIRTSKLSTIKSTRNITCIKKVFHLLWMIFSLDKYLNKNTPKCAIIDDLAYHEAAVAALFYKKGAKVVNVSPASEELIDFDEKFRTIRRGEKANQKVRTMINLGMAPDLSEVDNYFERLFQGDAGKILDRGAFKGKKAYKREEIIELYKLDPQKKVVVIMAHTFSDAVFNYGVLYFRDYYDWLEYTLKTVRAIKNVNWVLKPHPTRKAYHEDSDSIEKMYEKYKAENTRFLDDSISMESIKELADVIVTIGGNAGGEVACFGVPSIIVGTPYYKGFGYTIEPKNKQQYEEVLRKIDCIKPLTKKQIHTAKLVYYYGKIYDDAELSFRDGFAKLLNELYKKMLDAIVLEYFENDNMTKKYNDIITEKATEYINRNGIINCEYYMRGKKRGVEIKTCSNVLCGDNK